MTQKGCVYFFCSIIVSKKVVCRCEIMKKTILAILVCGIIILGLVGCGKSKNESKIGKESNTEITSTSDVTLSIKEDTLTNTGVTLLLKNNSDKDYSYGNPFGIEKSQDGKWYKLETINDIAFTLPAYGLKSGESKELSLYWKDMYGELKSGTYRIVKSISYQYEEGKYKTFYIAVEFKIDSD